MFTLLTVLKNGQSEFVEEDREDEEDCQSEFAEEDREDEED